MKITLQLNKRIHQVCLLCGWFALFPQISSASDWEEDNKSPEASKTEVKRIKRPRSTSDDVIPQTSETTSATSTGETPLQGKIEKSGTRIDRSLQNMTGKPDSTKTDPLSGKAIDNELKGLVDDGSLKGLSPTMGSTGDPLRGKAELQGGKGGIADPDEDDQELMVEWDRWHNRFLRAVQLGVQELLNNPDPEDYERPRVDPMTGNFTSRYPLGTGAAFSCQVTAEGQIKNLEIIETSGFPKYDRAVMRAVQQLAGTRILVFPKGSHRRNVIQPGRIKTATSNEFKYHHFGDVEKIRTPGR